MIDVFLKDENGIKQRFSGIESVSLDGNNNQKETFIQPTLQEKSIENKENGVTEVSADTGYDGLSKVTVKTSVPPTMQNYRLLTPTREPVKADWAVDDNGHFIYTTGSLDNGQMCYAMFADGQKPLIYIFNLGSGTGAGIPTGAHLLYSWQEVNAEQFDRYNNNFVFHLAENVTIPVGWSYGVYSDQLLVSVTPIDASAADWTIGSDLFENGNLNNYFYELFTLKNIEDKAVTVTQNGTTTISADHAALGIHQVDLTVDLATEEKAVALDMGGGDQVIEPSEGKTMSKLTVEKPVTMTPENIKAGVNIGGVDGTYVGSGGSSVQSDWAQNDVTAADYVKNRPGGYYATIPATTYTFDGDLSGKTVMTDFGLVLVSADAEITMQSLKGSTITVHKGTSAVEVSSFAVDDSMGFLAVMNDTGDAVYCAYVPSDAAGAQIGLTKGLWFGFETDEQSGAVAGYTQSLLLPVGKAPVKMPNELLPDTIVDWAAQRGSNNSIRNRIGGYFDAGLADIKIEFNGDITGKHVINVSTSYDGDNNLQSKVDLVQILDYPLAKSQLANTKEDSIVHQYKGTTISSGITIEGAKYLDNYVAAYGLACNIPTSPSGSVSGPIIVSDFLDMGDRKPGTYIVMTTYGDGSVSYLKQATIGQTFEIKYPNDLVEPPEQLETLDIGNSGKDNKKIKFRTVNNVPYLILPSSSNSKKQFKITVDDNGNITATEYTE